MNPSEMTARDAGPQAQLAFRRGSSYAGIAVAPNGTVYVARNDMFLLGALRGVYACTPQGAELACTKAGSP